MQHHESPGYARYVLVILTLTYTCSYIDRYILSVLVEPIKAEFGVSDTLMGLLGGFAFALLYTLAGIPIARWADRGNRRTIIALGVAAWSLMTVASGFARSFLQLALARVGVGLGEAACTPPAHSLLADYFPPEKRATALAIYSMGIPFGVMFGFLAGGWIAHFFDWRTAFVVVGAPGLLLALVVRLTLREPERGRLDIAPASAPFTLGETLALIFRHRALLLIQLGGAFYAIAGYGLSFWIAPFFARVHQLPLNELASWLALGALVGGVGGSFAAIALLLGVPVTVVMLTVGDPRIALALFLVQQFTFFCYSGPIYAVMQFLVPSTMRAMVVAVHLFVLNLVGLGFGPLLIGMMNDGFAASLGSDGAIRLSLLVITLGTLVSVLCFWLAAGNRDGKPIAVPIPAR